MTSLLSMASERENSMVERKAVSASAGVRASQLFVAVEHGVYFATGVLLALTAVLALVSAAISIWEATLVWGAPEQIIVTIDRLLFVLMLVEVLHTVRVSLRDGKLTAEPFLVVGLIASIRRVLAITLGSSHATQPGHWTPDAAAVQRIDAGARRARRPDPGDGVRDLFATP
jgi:uncharacterized membrane protein (DUF373 family)